MNDTENLQVQSLIMNELSTPEVALIGAYRNEDGDYLWYDEAAMTYNQWYYSDDSDDEDCVMMDYFEGIWLRVPCEADFPAVVCWGTLGEAPEEDYTPVNDNFSIVKASLDGSIDTMTAENQLEVCESYGLTTCKILNQVDQNSVKEALLAHEDNLDGAYIGGFTETPGEAPYTWGDGTPITYSFWSFSPEDYQFMAMKRTGHWITADDLDATCCWKEPKEVIITHADFHIVVAPQGS